MIEPIQLAPYLEALEERVERETRRQRDNSRILKEAGKGRNRKARAKSIQVMTPAKQAHAVALARLKARRALREKGYDFTQAAELLWSWSRQNTALRLALIRVAIGTLTGFQAPPEDS